MYRLMFPASAMPVVYLGYLAAHTENIALGVGSIILPLRHPAHVAKAAATADVLSHGRILLPCDEQKLSRAR